MKVRKEFERTALPYQKDLYFAALTLTRNEHDALDLAQETFIKAYRSFSALAPGSNIKAWLFTILRNTAIDRARKQHRQATLLELEAVEEPAIEPNEPLPLSEALPHDLWRAFSGLSRRQQLLLLLCDIEEFSYREIAEILQCPIGSVMSGIHNARSRLRSILSGR